MEKMPRNTVQRAQKSRAPRKPTQGEERTFRFALELHDIDALDDAWIRGVCFDHVLWSSDPEDRAWLITARRNQLRQRARDLGLGLGELLTAMEQKGEITEKTLSVLRESVQQKANAQRKLKARRAIRRKEALGLESY